MRCRRAYGRSYLYTHSDSYGDGDPHSRIAATPPAGTDSPTGYPSGTHAGADFNSTANANAITTTAANGNGNRNTTNPGPGYRR